MKINIENNRFAEWLTELSANGYYDHIKERNSGDQRT